MNKNKDMEKLNRHTFLYEIFDEKLLTERYKFHKGKIKDLAYVKTADGEKKAPKIAALAAVAPYLDALSGVKHWIDYKRIDIMPDCDKAAELLDRSSLMEFIKKNIGVEKNSKWLYPYCRYASEKEIRELCALSKNKSNKKDAAYYTYRLPVGALLLSDTKSAMIELYNAGLYFRTPPFEDYAKMRGTDCDSIIDEVLPDLGLNENGEREYDLGSFKVKAGLTPNLKLNLYNEKNGKYVRSVPKRGADSEKYETAISDFAELKYFLRNAVKIRLNRLYVCFLDAHERSSGNWRAANLKNPLNRQIAQFFVWEQSGITFTVTGNKLITAAGKEFTMTDAPVKLAHPMEMGKAKVSEWKKYFADNKIQQPFLQLWEPVRDPGTIKEDRYSGIDLPAVWFSNKEKHGIFYQRHMSEKPSLSFSDCDVRYHFISRANCPHKDQVNVYSFKFKEYTRKTNHIVTFLDNWTLYGRIKKDDMSVIEELAGATAARLEKCADIAIENGAKNLTAKLLEMKKQRFPEFDAMEEFALGEWEKR